MAASSSFSKRSGAAARSRADTPASIDSNAFDASTSVTAWAISMATFHQRWRHSH